MENKNTNAKEMFINSVKDESRVAIVKNGLLTELSVEQSSGPVLKGNIYKGRVVQIQESIHAAFVEFGEKRHGFLALDEVNFDMYPLLNSESDRRTIKSRLKTGQSVLVQVIREPTDTKGAAISTFVSLPGMCLVFSPKNGEGGVSKKIQDSDERERLKSFVSGIASENNSVIVRTGGIGKNLNDLKKEYVNLRKEWEQIQNTYDATEKYGLIYTEEVNSVRMIRDYYTNDIENIWIDNPETFQKVHSYFRLFIPTKISQLKLYMGEKSIFSNFSIESQIENLSDSKISLPSGGSLVIQQTEAMVTIDVNSGRSNQESFSQRTAFRTNLEAAEEVARQLRLRNLAGLVVIDFIDMKYAEDRKKIEDTIEEAMKEDKASHNLSKISEFGLLELSRQRLSQGYAVTMEDKCPHCRGTGRIPNQITYCNHMLRKIKNIASEKNVSSISMTLPSDMAIYILNDKRGDLFDIEMEFNVTITVNASNDLSNSEIVKIHTDKSGRTARVGKTRPTKTLHSPPGEYKSKKEDSKEIVEPKKPDRPTRSETSTPVAHKLPSEKPVPKLRTPLDEKIAGEIASGSVAGSCLFKNVKHSKTVDTTLMDQFYGNVSGRKTDTGDIFIDKKYLLDVDNVSNFFSNSSTVRASKLTEKSNAHGMVPTDISPGDVKDESTANRSLGKSSIKNERHIETDRKKRTPTSPTRASKTNQETAASEKKEVNTRVATSKKSIEKPSKKVDGSPTSKITERKTKPHISQPNKNVEKNAAAEKNLLSKKVKKDAVAEKNLPAKKVATTPASNATKPKPRTSRVNQSIKTAPEKNIADSKMTKKNLPAKKVASTKKSASDKNNS